MKRILIGGNYGSGNAGDEAILSAMVRGIRERNPGVGITVASRDPRATERDLGVETIPALVGEEILAASARSDLVVLGGGGILQDYLGAFEDTLLSPACLCLGWFGSFPLAAAICGKPSMLFAAGAGPLATEGGRLVARLATDSSSVVTVRDEASAEALRIAGARGDRIEVTADPAFLMEPDREAGRALLESRGLYGHEPLVAVSIRHWDAGRHPWIPELARALSRLPAEARLVLLPFQSRPGFACNDDADALAGLRAELERADTATLMPGDVPAATLAGVISHCSAVVGLRFHSIVFAAMSGVPFLALDYDPKVRSLVERLGASDALVGLARIEAEDLAHRIQALLESGSDQRAALEVAVSVQRKAAWRNFELLFDLLDSPPTELPEGAEAFRRWFAMELPRRLQESQRLLSQTSSELEAISAERHRLARRDAEARVIFASRGWHLLESLWALRRAAAPPGSRRAKFTRSGLKAALRISRLVVAPIRGTARAFGAPVRWRDRWLKSWRRVFEARYRIEDCATVTLFTDSAEVFPGYSPRRPMTGERTRHVSVTLVATSKNERRTVQTWLETLMSQQRMPDACVLADAGSTDGTREALVEFAGRAPFPVTVLDVPGSSIAQGRNVAIRAASSEVIAVTDFGCRLDPMWLDRLVAPFETAPGVQVAAGWYEAILPSGSPAPRRKSSLATINPRWYTPSSNSIAFLKTAWVAAGGYPEWLSSTGEDTLFDMELKRLSLDWAFVPEAIVLWEAPSTILGDWKKTYRWARGDGESGLFAGDYLKEFNSLVSLQSGEGFFERGCRIARVSGFRAGWKRRDAIEQQRALTVRGTIFILSGVPIDDIGGGSRYTQLALEFLRQGFAVVFLHKFSRYESIDLKLRIEHRNLRVMCVDNFGWEEFVRLDGWLLKTASLTALVEMPLPEYIPLIDEIRRIGGRVVYDLVDDWETSLGSGWYSRSVEDDVIRRSDALIAVSPRLVRGLQKRVQRSVTLVPNAVNREVFDPDREHDPPADLPSGLWRAVYVGSLWGDWFDWDLLTSVARAYPEAAVVVIGDYRGQCVNPPRNLHFLGLRRQAVVPAYLANCDVGIIPWKISSLTDAASPLKVYEYLAMRKSVVAPALGSLDGLPGVFQAKDAAEFVVGVGEMRGRSLERDIARQLVSQNAWDHRVAAILDSLSSLPRNSERPESDSFADRSSPDAPASGPRS